MTHKARCKEKVYPSGMAFPRPSQCQRLAVLDGYCKQHAPLTIAAKNEARSAKWDHKRAIRKAGSAVEQAAAKIVEAVDAFDSGSLPRWIESQAIEYRRALARLAELKGGGA